MNSIRCIILIFIVFTCVVASIDCCGQGKITRPKSEAKITYRRMDQLNDEVAYRAEGSNGKYGVIDRYDNLILPCKFTWVDPFKANQSYVQLRKNGKYAVINEKGEFITGYMYDYVDTWREGVETPIKVGMLDPDRPGYFKYGYIDINGKEIIPIMYLNPNNSSAQFKDGKVKLILNGREIWFDKAGNEVTQ